MTEQLLHEQIAQYLRYQYPDILFHSDYGSGVRLTMGQAVRQRRLQAGRSWPDLFVAAPRGPWHGLFLELKAEGTIVWLKNGQLTANVHIREQAALLLQLRQAGYMAEFGIGFEPTTQLLDEYLKQQ